MDQINPMQLEADSTSTVRTERARKGFTLIELLVVIAIIALLIGILLPTLAGARDASFGVACMARLRELAYATEYYARDHKDQIWGNETNNGWARVPRPGGGLQPGPAYDYLDNVGEMLGCPKNKRRSPDGDRRRLGDSVVSNDAEVDFDYTMIDGVQGLRTSTGPKVYYLDRIEAYRGGRSPVGMTQANGRQLLKLFRANPIFVEESAEWYNGAVPDGRWGNLDQMTTRHGGDAYYTMIDVSVEKFEVTSGQSEELQEPRDFVANDVYIYGGRPNPRGGPPSAPVFFRLWDAVGMFPNSYGMLNSGTIKPGR